MKHQEKPPEGNLTKPMEFVLLDFADVPHLQWFLFGLFLIIYIMILIGNGTVFLITKLDPALQTPMYFFTGQFFLLGNLLRVSCSPQNAHESLHPEKNNLFSCLCCTNVLLPHAGSH